MATTRLSDVYIPELYDNYQAINSPEKTAFYESGIIARNATLDAKANEGGRKIELPFWKDLDTTGEPNLSNDDPAILAVPDKVDTGVQEARKAFLNNGWSTMDLTGELAGSSPMRRIKDRTSAYWTKMFQKRLLSTVTGVFAGNLANDGGDMIIDVSIADGDNATAANLFSRQTFTAAVYTSGDSFDVYNAIAVNSVVHKRMVDNDDIEYIKDSEGNILMQRYLGLRVIVDDSMPVVAGATSGLVYTSVLFGSQAIGHGVGTPETPSEVERVAASGNGGGSETLWERNTDLVHPFGFAFTSANVVDESASIAELADATNWSRVVDRKNVPLAFIQTNG